MQLYVAIGSSTKQPGLQKCFPYGLPRSNGYLSPSLLENWNSRSILLYSVSRVLFLIYSSFNALAEAGAWLLTGSVLGKDTNFDKTSVKKLETSAYAVFL